MFDRFLRFAEARRAVRRGRFEQALKSLDDPAVREDRRAQDLRQRAVAGLLARAGERLAQGLIEVAQQELQFLLGFDKENEAAGDLLRQCRTALEQKKIATVETAAQLAKARRLVEGGQLQQAERLLAELGDGPEVLAGRRAMLVLVAGRRVKAQQDVECAAKALGAQQFEAASHHARAALALDDSNDTAKDLLDRARLAMASDAVAGVRRHLEVGDLEAAAELLRTAEAAPQAAMVLVQQGFRDALDTAVREVDFERLRQLLTAGRWLQQGPMQFLFAGACALLEVRKAEEQGDLELAVASLREILLTTESTRLTQYRNRLEEAACLLSDQWQKAKAATIAGDLAAAQKLLNEMAARHPGHEMARRALGVLEQNADERARQLAQVRDCAAAGRLREAYRMALLIVAPGPIGDEVRVTMKELQHRMELVDQGLDQVRRILHGRDSGSLNGLRQCLARLDQLAVLQSDHEELIRLRDGVLAEIEGLDALAVLQAEAAKGNRVAVQAAAGMVLAVQPRLVHPSRLDARMFEAMDRLESRIRGELHAGRAGAGAAFATILGSLAASHDSFKRRASELLARCELRLAAAAEAGRQGSAALAARDLESAARYLESAQQEAMDAPAAVELEEALRHVHQQAAMLDVVSGLTEAGEHGEANRRLADMDQTPPILRTRIFDLKQRLARAQGLEQSFLLRVDDGGELLVLRGDSIVIGNLRDGSADLPVLAAIAGRHARIQRTLSFHGGVREKIIAERGAISVNGAPTAEHTLASGDRIRLGTTLELLYEMPSRRSLSARLTLKGGFRARGTDKILLLKDRGRDGRILIGPAKDSHVRIASASGEIELFAHKDGQVRVRLEGSATMDGKIFSGEHPVTPGAMIQACGINFLVLPFA